MKPLRHFGFLAAVFALVKMAVAADSFPVSIHVDAGNPKSELKPIWRFFGCDEPNYAYMNHGKKLLGELGELRPSRFSSARTISSVPAMARPPSSGARPVFTRKTPMASRFTIGRSLIASSTPTSKMA
jgi:hypothetical protein